jgi:xylulokinase
VRDALLGIDLGTSSVKVCATDLRGNVLAHASTDVTTRSPRPGWHEQDPAHWWQALGSAVRDLIGDPGMSGVRIMAAGLTGQMHGPVLLDGAGASIGPCLIWSDTRTAAEVEEINALLPRRRVIEVTGSAPNASFTAAKLLWLRRNRPAAFARARTVLLPKDYLRHRLTGCLRTDVSDASATLLFDVAARAWSDELVDGLGLDRGLLPPVAESATVDGRLLAEPARELGLEPGLPVIVGGGDAPAAALAAGITAATPGVGLLTLGTSGQVLLAHPNPVIDHRGRLHSLCHVLAGQWCVMAAILSAGASLRWGQRLVSAERLSLDVLLAEAAELPAGADGLVFTPYLAGERTPHMDPHARGALVGLRESHRRGHLIRAILEGVAFALRDGLDALHDAGAEASVLRCTGGGARSELWCQIVASVLGRPVEVADDPGSSYGAALLAGLGTDAILPADIGRSDTVIRYEPDPALVDQYAAGHRRYRRISEATRPDPE